MTRHSDFEQTVGGLELMYRAVGATRQRRETMSAQWYATFAGGSMDQIEQLMGEVHPYLGLPYPLPRETAPAADPPPLVDDAARYPVALETFLRLYRGLGAMKNEVGQFCPHLYAAVVAMTAPQLAAVRAALHDYLGWDDLRRTEAEMEQQFAGESANGAPAGTAAEPAAGPSP